ncbi:hypothetical protein PRIPAC_70193 [Pristionchus pacificus]|uniref:Uncharacterized protein n=1 Tax=Pristionchus pacificus TaxID=54126 RepID=A0A2A6C028_PRIPA|nr:hypothetical protein PRIPAC_70193 [Pristionchus pacificus]|eukprot:PDM71456.1 hypothetical protein PRIPAC_37863 [Pristionchus pacificus]
MRLSLAVLLLTVGLSTAIPVYTSHSEDPTTIPRAETGLTRTPRTARCPPPPTVVLRPAGSVPPPLAPVIGGRLLTRDQVVPPTPRTPFKAARGPAIIPKDFGARKIEKRSADAFAPDSLVATTR